MPLPVVYTLADVDGEVCVAARQTDWNEPRYVINHWPTPFGTRRLLSDLEIDSLDQLTIVDSMPGEFVITHVRGERVYGNHLRFCLSEGGRTKSILTTFADVPRPRIGKGSKLEWLDGRWHKTSPKGKPQIIVV